MAQSATPIASRERLWRIALALLPALALVLLRGVDTNWDLRNYHLYGPHAWWTGRMAIDIAPAQLQTWHNPLLDLPLYWLVMSGWDLRWSSAWLTLPYAVAIYFLLGLQSLLSPARPSPTAQVVLALLAMSGATVWATMGNSMNDGFVAAALLGSLLLVLGEPCQAPKRWWLAGLVAGAMMGLKLTASVYCLALAAAAWLGTSAPWRLRGKRILALAIGGLLGFLLTYGWWGWTLQQAFGNPFFPYYNDLFGSPWAAARDYADARFRVHGLLDAVTIPLQLLRDGTARSELYIRDPRLLLGAVGLPALAWWLHRRAPALAWRARLLAVFFWVSLLAWALQYGIYRYVALLELLGALALVAWLAQAPKWPGAVLLLALVVASKATHRPDWGHARNALPRYGLRAPPIADDGLVVTASGEPLAFLALALPPSVPMIGLSTNMHSPGDCSLLQRRAGNVISQHAGGIWLLSANLDSVSSGLAFVSGHYALEPSGDCFTWPNSLADPVLCPLHQASPVAPCGSRQ